MRAFLQLLLLLNWLINSIAVLVVTCTMSSRHRLLGRRSGVDGVCSQLLSHQSRLPPAVLQAGRRRGRRSDRVRHAAWHHPRHGPAVRAGGGSPQRSRPCSWRQQAIVRCWQRRRCRTAVGALDRAAGGILCDWWRRGHGGAGGGQPAAADHHNLGRQPAGRCLPCIVAGRREGCRTW